MPLAPVFYFPKKKSLFFENEVRKLDLKFFLDLHLLGNVSTPYLLDSFSKVVE
jgi:hypothetical protein